MDTKSYNISENVVGSSVNHTGYHGTVVRGVNVGHMATDNQNNGWIVGSLDRRPIIPLGIQLNAKTQDVGRSFPSPDCKPQQQLVPLAPIPLMVCTIRR